MMQVIFLSWIMCTMLLGIYGNYAIYDDNNACVCYTDSNRVGTKTIRIEVRTWAETKRYLGSVFCV